jgi:hypothetical protein
VNLVEGEGLRSSGRVHSHRDIDQGQFEEPFPCGSHYQPPSCELPVAVRSRERESQCRGEEESLSNKRVGLHGESDARPRSPRADARNAETSAARLGRIFQGISRKEAPFDAWVPLRYVDKSANNAGRRPIPPHGKRETRSYFSPRCCGRGPTDVPGTLVATAIVR